MSKNSKLPGIVVAHFPAGDGNPYNKLLAQALEAEGIDVDSIPNLFHRNPWRVLNFTREYRLVHFHWLDGHYNGRSFVRFFLRSLLFLGTLSFFKLHGTRMVQTVHNLVPHEHSYRGLHRMVSIALGRLMDRLIVHNPASVDRVSQEFCARDKVVLVEHIDYGPWVSQIGAESTISAGKGAFADNSRKKIIFFGQLRPYKGIETLLEAAARCDHDFCIVGRPYTKEYGHLLDSKVAMLPNVSLIARFVQDAELSTILFDSDVAVFPYGDTLCSGAAHYALAHNLPAVASATTAFEELIDLGLAIEWSAPFTSEQLARSIDRACRLEKQTWSRVSVDYRKRCSAISVGPKLRTIYTETLALGSGEKNSSQNTN